MKHLLSTRTLPVALLFSALALYAQPAATQQKARGAQPTVAAPKTDGFVLLKGTILEAASRKPLAGASVRYKNISAAITDASGNFSIKVPDYKVSVEVEAPGFQLKEIALQGASSVQASLMEDAFSSVYDAANTPAGTLLQSQSPFSQRSLNLSGAWERPFETADTYLQGKVAGLNVIRRSGTPGSGASLFLRGLSSLNATNQPLLVIDGILYDNTEYGTSMMGGSFNNPLSMIDIKDIDNITVIKDATSLYGTKGANGVIQITTARARELATRIDFAAYTGINFAPKALPLMGAADYRTLVSGMLQTAGMSAAQLAAQPWMNDNTASADYYRYHNNTDWQNQVLKNAAAQNYYLKITGGDNIARYALSMGYLANEGTLRNSGVKRYNTRFNGDFNLSRRLTASTNLSFTFNEQNLRDQGQNTNVNLLLSSLLKSPLLRVNEVSASGAESPDLAGLDIFNRSNPVALSRLAIGQNNSYRFMGVIGFNYQINPAFSLQTNLGVTLDKVRETMFLPSKGVLADSLATAVAKNRSGSAVKRLFQLLSDTRLQYQKTFGNIHDLSAAIGFRYQTSQIEEDFGKGFNSATDELRSVSFGLNTLRQIGGNLGLWRWTNQYSSIDYRLRNRYLLSLQAAFDGSSRFGKLASGSARRRDGINLAFMPSLSAGWVVSSESFMKDLPFVDHLKLRATYGLTGNDDIGNYTTRNYYVSQNLLGLQGLVRGNIGNDKLQWEEATKFNGGIDLALFKERVSLSVDAYKQRTRHMLLFEPAPAASGLTTMATSNAGMSVNGWEAALNLRLVNQPKLKWDIGGTVGNYRMRITEMPGGAKQTAMGDATYMSAVGGQPNAFWGQQATWVYATDADAAAEGLSIRTANGQLVPFKGGDMRFADLNGDKVIDDADRTNMGNPNPQFFGGFQTGLTYKRFNLQALATYSYGNEVYNSVRRQLESASGYANQLASVIERWTKNGDMNAMPRATWGDPMGNGRFSSRWIEDGSYLRLRTVSLSYNLPVKAGLVKYAVVYANGNNLVTLTRYKGYDPEFSAGNSLYAQGVDAGMEPQVRSVQAGVRIGL
ncbi:TonB-linked outer membrane protein, SusC/RagA family [Cnuella takakiae]|uniref:TonB-linked outer membrane protein, SusC/RagA family n=1 Tax=Cnuella takakiae TaxID=1302690 RepID=A0A1M4UQM3_9BACT|nr:SusC/RagA family TonB-linked outer membrane protein [Cnuella takakiae]OLY92802.1 SusC/RagA family TonB-linked outer membrane protein [Cnuella takakiae]SHE58989.1 TonB-linked outer membrane protein, SusC/RagA family [Cnuella takakiae]